ncbi:MAG: hypothetical protein OEZ01_17855, partial [Candidatus Heimdallarchaeota archaeon]|nr:hypothetical protein [Candidatus Heimdallarchaeota archaeon]
LSPKNEDSEKINIEEDQQAMVKQVDPFDKKLYYKTLSTRSQRLELAKKRITLKNEVSALLEQIQTGLISREYASPKIKEISAKVEEINTEDKIFDGIPNKLPVEILNDELDAAENRIRKLDNLKSDPSITKETLQEAKRQGKEVMEMLKSQQSMIFGHLRKWKSEIEEELKEKRKELEMLYIKLQTGELVTDVYEERKEAKAKEIQIHDNVNNMLEVILSN